LKQKNKKKKISKNSSNEIKQKLPHWIDKKLWAEFMKVRVKLKAVQTDYALELLVSKLEDFQERGNDPNQLIKNSIENSWKTFYEPNNFIKNNKNGKDNETKHNSFNKQDWHAGSEGFDVI